jgi:hypothetical protein
MVLRVSNQVLQRGSLKEGAFWEALENPTHAHLSPYAAGVLGWQDR